MVSKIDYITFAGYDIKQMKEELDAFEKKSLVEQKEYFKARWIDAIKAQTKDLTNLIKLYESLAQREKNIYFEQLAKENPEFHKQFQAARKTGNVGNSVPKNTASSTSLTEQQTETQKMSAIPDWFKENMDELFEGVSIDYQEIEQFCRKLAKEDKEESRIDHLKQKIEGLKKEGKCQDAFVLLKFLSKCTGIGAEFDFKSNKNNIWIAFQDKKLERQFNEMIEGLRWNIVEVIAETDLNQAEDIATIERPFMKIVAKCWLKKGTVEAAIEFGKTLPTTQFFTSSRFSFLLELAKACIPQHIAKIELVFKEAKACIGPGTSENLTMMYQEMCRVLLEVANSLAKFEETHLPLLYHCIASIQGPSLIGFCHDFVRVFDQFSKLSTFEALMKLHLDQKKADIMGEIARSACKTPAFKKFLIETFPRLDELELKRAVGGIISYYCQTKQFEIATESLKYLEKYPEEQSSWKESIASFKRSYERYLERTAAQSRA